jgi:hypothetical protein
LSLRLTFLDHSENITALCNFDIDLIFFVIKETPPFKSVLSELENHLRCVLPRIEMKRTTGISVQFIMDGFNVDLLPAPNLVDKAVSFKALEQFARAMEKIKPIPAKDIIKDVRIWSPAPAETTVQFMKKQSAFVNVVVRLAKLWKASCKTLSSTFPVWFISFLVEIIAFDAAKTELADHPNDASLVRVLEHFLMMLSMPDQLCMATIENECPARISNRRPFVLDPVNPYCNLVSQLRDWTTIRVLAVSKLDVLRKTGSSASQILILDLFRPQLCNDIPAMFKWCNFTCALSWKAVGFRLSKFARLKTSEVSV